MPDLTPAHRDHARRALVASGYPIGDDVDALERIRRTELLEAVATAVAIAEDRGPAGGRTEPTAAEEDAYRDGLGQAFSESLAVLTAPNPEASIRHIARSYGVTRDLEGPPGTATAQLLRDTVAAGEATPAGPRGPSADVVLEDDPADENTVDPTNPFTAAEYERDREQVRRAAANRADRMSWSTGDLQITPPPAGGDQ